MCQEGIFLFLREEGTRDACAAEFFDLRQREVPAHCDCEIVAAQHGIRLVCRIVRADDDGDSGRPVHGCRMLGKVCTVAQGGIAHGTDLDAYLLFPYLLFKLRIAVQVESVSQPVYAAPESNLYLLVLSAETLSCVQREVQSRMGADDFPHAVSVAGE